MPRPPRLLPRRAGTPAVRLGYNPVMEKMPLLVRLSALYPQAKKTTLRDMVRAKRVRINGTVVKSLKQEVTEEDRVEVADFADVVQNHVALAEGLRLVYFDADIAIVDKPAGLLTSTDEREMRPTVWRILRTYFSSQNQKNQVFLIHRIDRDASGLLVFGRSRDAYVSLKKQFFEHTINRQYGVVVHGIPQQPTARLEHLLLEDPHTGVVRVTRDAKTGKPAALDYEVVASDAKRKLSLLRCTLFTGRKHQIRVQLKVAGHAVCGDPIYGKADEPPGRLALHAMHLAFVHPRSKKKMAFESPMPLSFGHLAESGK